MSKVFLKKLGKNIKSLRLSKKISQEKLAEMLGVSRNFIGMIERAEVNTPVATLYKIAKILGVKTSDFFIGV